MTEKLKDKKCIPCSINQEPLSGKILGEHLSELHEDWQLDDDNKKLTRVLHLKDFTAAISFINSIAEIAEHEGHHPDIHLENFNRVTLEIWTHKIGGLSDNDFILAAKIDNLFITQ